MPRASTGMQTTFASEQTNWSTSGWNSDVVNQPWPNNGIDTSNNVNVSGTTDLFGSSTYAKDDNVKYNTSNIIAILKDAVLLYDRGTKDRREVAKEVDRLRRKISSGTFDPQKSPELLNIFGHMFGDVIADLSTTNGGDYDSIIDYIMDSFPEGSGGPTESKYVKSQLDNQVKNAIKAIQTYERRNGFTTSTNKTKFLKIVDQLKIAKPDVVIPDLEVLWEKYQEYNNNK